MARVDSIYTSPRSAEAPQSVQRATLIAGVGVEGDRYALGTGTYSARFLGEPGRQLTMFSADGLEAALRRGFGFADADLREFDLGQLRRNLALRGISAEAVNAMEGHEVRIGDHDSGVRLFVHRRTVPCKYREAQMELPGLMNKLWEDCGVNCEILVGGEVRVGDEVSIVGDTFDKKRCDTGFKPAAFFIRPADRMLEQARQMVIPPVAAFFMCLVDPAGFERLQAGYQSVGQQFWSPQAWKVGMAARRLRAPVLALGVALGVAGVAVAVGAVMGRGRGRR